MLVRQKAIILLYFIPITAVIFFAPVMQKTLSAATAQNNSLGAEIGESNEEIRKLNEEIDSKKDSIKDFKAKEEEYTEAIRLAQEQSATLDAELAILENRIAKAQLDIEKTVTEIDKTQLEIQKMSIQISDTEGEIESDKQHIENVLRLLYKKDSMNSLEIMLTNDDFSDFINDVQYIQDINKEVGNTLAALKIKKAELVKQQASQVEKKTDLQNLKTRLEGEKQKLEAERENQEYILEETRLSEERYQRLLVDAKKEQDSAASEIASLEKTVRERMAEMDRKKLEFNDSGLIWPVTKNVVTSYFHDPEYPFRNIFEHPAIDIRAGQGTQIRAAASGYVARAKDAGKGYSYIMLVHGDGISTVYGHVSKIMVSDDDFVMQGQVIGLSGGLPGTPGAGRLTTGPHLHFEVRQNGIPVNPLEYLP